MLIQHESLTRVHHDNEVMPSNYKNFDPKGFHCCYYNCKDPIWTQFMPDNSILIRHCSKSSVQHIRGPVNHNHTKDNAINAYKDHMNCIRVCARCPTCNCATKTRPLVINPKIVAFSKFLVLTDKHRRVIIYYTKHPHKKKPFYIDFLLGPTKQTLIFFSSEIRSRLELDIGTIGQLPCKKHKEHLEYPLHIIAKKCPRCSTKHSILTIQNENAKRYMNSFYLRNEKYDKITYNMWSVPLDGSSPTPVLSNYQEKFFSSQDKSTRFFFSEDNLHPQKKQLYETTVINAQLHILKRQPKLSFYEGNIFEVQDPIIELCNPCIQNEKQKEPCCRMCDTTIGVDKDTGECTRCMKLFTEKIPQFKNSDENNTFVEDLAFPEMNSWYTAPSINTSLATLCAHPNWTRQHKNADDFIRCHNCGTITIVRLMFLIDKNTMKSSFFEIDSEDIVFNINKKHQDTVALCVMCVKKCKQCNNMLYANDPMSKCKRCCIAKSNKQNYSDFDTNPICQSMTISGGII